jgi:glycosyltransferase involved in cell wall biosynthesis
MKISVLINNYNYANYIAEAIESVAAQSRVPDELIIVDDGSTDDSLDIIQQSIKDLPFARVVATDNRGQLSAANEGFSASSSDLLFFLDADDIYEPDHIEKCLRVFEEKPYVGFVYTSHQNFGANDEVHHCYDKSRQLGVGLLATYYQHEFIGSITSTLVVRKECLAPIFPLPEKFYMDWKLRADNIIVWAAGLTGACKYYLREPSVRYRIHSDNNFTGTYKETPIVSTKYNIASDRMIHFMWNTMGYSDQLVWKTADEFKTIEKPVAADVRRYLKIHLKTISSRRKRISLALKLYRLMLKER